MSLDTLIPAPAPEATLHTPCRHPDGAAGEVVVDADQIDVSGEVLALDGPIRVTLAWHRPGVAPQLVVEVAAAARRVRVAARATELEPGWHDQALVRSDATGPTVASGAILSLLARLHAHQLAHGDGQARWQPRAGETLPTTKPFPLHPVPEAVVAEHALEITELGWRVEVTPRRLQVERRMLEMAACAIGVALGVAIAVAADTDAGREAGGICLALSAAALILAALHPRRRTRPRRFVVERTEAHGPDGERLVRDVSAVAVTGTGPSAACTVERTTGERIVWVRGIAAPIAADVLRHVWGVPDA